MRIGRALSWAVLPVAMLVLGGSALAQESSTDTRVRLREGVTREALDAEGQALYDSVVNAVTPYARGLPTPLGVWMHSPGMAKYALPLYMYLRFGGDAVDAIHFPVRLVELAILVTAHEIKSQHQWTAHEATSLKAGLEPRIIDVVKNGKSLDGVGEKEAAIVQFGRELFRNRRVGASTFTRAQRLFGAAGVTDLAGLMAFHEFLELSSFAAFDIPSSPGEKSLLPLQ
jgi:4-carboxymuconolactone decarboxylase